MKTLNHLHLFSTRLLARKNFSVLLLAFILSVLLSPAANSQTFDSTSDGSDGALNLTTPGTIEFDPVALGFDPDGDHIFHFTNITIGPGVIVRLSAKQINASVFWLSSGPVQIDGIVDLNGEDGQNGDDILGNAGPPSVPGAGGFGGGVGRTSVTQIGQPGTGPGAGKEQGGRGGGGAGHVNGGGGAPGSNNTGGQEYGNIFQNPLLGGSGGAGGSRFDSGRNSGDGGAGGGALLIASSSSITINGTIQANGGNGGNSASAGGGGASGGSIRLAANTVSGTGGLIALGGTRGAHTGGAVCLPGGGFATCRGGSGSNGRIRIEAFENTFGGSVNPIPSVSSPFAVSLPVTPAPSIRVVSVDGVVVPENPSGGFSMPDATINNGAPVSVAIEAQHIPLGTVAQLHLLTEDEGTQIIDSTPLVGTAELSTATVTATLPGGFSRGFVRVTWSATGE